MISAKEFRNTYIGKAIDVDGAAGVQCVDLFKQCCYLAGKKAFALGGSGYADEIVHRFTALGLDDYFTKVSLADARYGDWCVWDKGSKEAPDSHVAMFEKKDGSSRAIFLGQNQGGVSKATEISISTSGIIGVLRLKAWATTGKKTVTTRVVNDVINGKYGNGTARKKALEAAGYDYDEVQAAVNEKLGSGSSNKTVTTKLVNDVINGKYGNGTARKKALEAAGYDYDEVQAAVNKALS